MTGGYLKASCGCRALFALLLLAAVAAAQSYKVQTQGTPPPEELAPAIRESLAHETIRVVGPEGLLCEIWLRKTVPARAVGKQELGVAYGQLAEGTLVGVVRFIPIATDYRRQRIKPGVYTLRYALQPVDGNHMGVSPYRDFLLLAPAAADLSPAPVIQAELLNLSRQASGTGHPSVWSLTAAEGNHSTLPALAHKEEEDHWILYFRVVLQPENASPSGLVMALVVVGHAPEA